MTEKSLTWFKSILKEENAQIIKERLTSIPVIFIAGTAAKDCISTVQNHFLAEKNFYQCGGYQSGTVKCTVHNIKEQVLDTIVLTQLKSMIALANNHSDEFYAMATEKGKTEAKKYYATAEKEKSQVTTRLHELDNIIRCLYEDRVVGRITWNAMISSRQATKKNKHRFVQS